jgi:predicted Zn-dependent protease
LRAPYGAAFAPHLPYSWRHGLGRYVVKAVTAGDTFCTAAAGRNALDTLVARMVAVSGHSEPVRVEVTVSKAINAFATPGGSIVVFNGLIDDAESAEELAGVLGHELGHVMKEHPTDGVIRGLGVGFAMTVIFGGSDGGLASAAATVHALSYGRRAEREADAIAADLLEKLNVDPKALASFFARLEKKEDTDGFGVLTYLSSHPATSERIAATQSRRAPPVPEKVLTDEAWQDLKTICKKAGES